MKRVRVDHLMLSRPGIRRVPTNATPPAHPPVLMVEPPTEALSGKIFFLIHFFSFGVTDLVVVEVWGVVEAQPPH